MTLKTSVVELISTQAPTSDDGLQQMSFRSRGVFLQSMKVFGLGKQKSKEIRGEGEKCWNIVFVILIKRSYWESEENDERGAQRHTTRQLWDAKNHSWDFPFE